MARAEFFSIVAAAAALVLLVDSASAASFVVDTTADSAAVGFQACTGADNDCSLRGAVIKANTTGGAPHDVIVRSGTYTLTLAGAGEDSSQTGDLDILAPIFIRGSGADTTIIEAGTTPANGIDRVLDVRATGVLTLNDVTVRHGLTGAVGGGIHVASGSAIALNRVTLTENTSTSGGGMDASVATVLINDSAIVFNHGSSSGGLGFFNATATLTNVTISGNDAAQGAALLSNGGSVTFNNASIINNASTANASPLAALGGGTFTFTNSIVAGNTSGGASPQCQAVTVSNGTNLDSDNSCGFNQGTDLTGLDPQVAPLRMNGGTTPTHGLRTGSQAIDQGNSGVPGSGGNTCAAADQRGIPRPFDGNGVGGARCDIGAHEHRADRQASTTGAFRPSDGHIFLKNANTSGFADIDITYGIPNDAPLAGNWDGNTTDTLGVYRNGQFLLRNTNTTGFADIVATFGLASDKPVTGDWNGDGVDTPGVFRNGTFFLVNTNAVVLGTPVLQFALGIAGDLPISGDWEADGNDTVGVFRPSDGHIFLKYQNTSGFADVDITFGLPGDQPLTGDWNNDGIDTIGVYRTGQMLLRNTNTTGFADLQFALGIAGDAPIAGDWDGLP